MTLPRPYPARLAAGALALAAPLALAAGADADAPRGGPQAHAAHHPLTIREAKRQILDNIESEWSVADGQVSLRCGRRGRYRVRCGTSFTTGAASYCGVSTARAYGPDRHRVMTRVRVRLCG